MAESSVNLDQLQNEPKARSMVQCRIARLVATPHASEPGYSCQTEACTGVHVTRVMGWSCRSSNLIRQWEGAFARTELRRCTGLSPQRWQRLI